MPTQIRLLRSLHRCLPRSPVPLSVPTMMATISPPPPIEYPPKFKSKSGKGAQTQSFSFGAQPTPPAQLGSLPSHHLPPPPAPPVPSPAPVGSKMGMFSTLPVPHPRPTGPGFSNFAPLSPQFTGYHGEGCRSMEPTSILSSISQVRNTPRLLYV